MAIRRRPGSTKNPPIFSHEFIIQNHADIVSCVAMVILVGLMFQVTTPLASMFVMMQYNITSNSTEGEETKESGEEETRYMYGARDSFCIIFYFLISIVLHAVVQEYILDKLNRKLHLSKVKHSKFNESGQLVTFYLFSILWGSDIMMKEGFTQNLSHLWEGYPHTLLSFRSKFYFIIQIAYWIHAFPELYFQKVKKDEMGARIQYSAFYLFFVVAAYLLNLTRLGLMCIVLHYIAELTFHVARLLYFSEKTELSAPCFTLWAILFLLVRLSIISLTTLTVWFGLGRIESQGFDFASGNFNSPISRLSILAAVCLFQAWLIFNFLMFQLRRRRESQLASAKPQRKVVPVKSKDKKKKEETRAIEGGDQVDAVSASQATSDSPHSENGSVRARAKAKKK
ncbi:translocating chain-associated membrane protein 1-like isoform X1 [Diadema antillarum]|uniref:translocating chain-associated membrane protein 1-like isoform X1 n=1 Tax=Diadema antillarum TaxID=105358 RepID=UPI003A87BC7E